MSWLKKIFKRNVSPEEAESRRVRNDLMDAIGTEKDPEHKSRPLIRRVWEYPPVDYVLGASFEEVRRKKADPAD